MTNAALEKREDVVKQSVEVSRTVILPLETSNRKNQVLSAVLNPVRETMARTADVLPSYPESSWGGRSTSLYRQVIKNRPDSEREVSLPSGDTKKVKTPVLQAAMAKVSSNFATYLSNGRKGDRPSRDRYLEATYVPVKGDDIEVVENERGYGLSVQLISYADPVWWHIQSAPYHDSFLERIVDDDSEASAGETELHIDEDGRVHAHLSVSWEVPTYIKEDVETVVGVYFTPSTLFATAAVELQTDSDESEIEGIHHVEVENSDEFRHKRDEIRKKRDRLMEKGHLNRVKDVRNQWENYTEQTLDVASKRIIEIASDVAPCEIRIPDFTHFRENVDEQHEWPYRAFADKITYKAENAGLPVTRVPTYNVAQTCRKCGHQIEDSERHLECSECGYQVRREVNAAFNVATGGFQE
jgi:rubrerythrin